MSASSAKRIARLRSPCTLSFPVKYRDTAVFVRDPEEECISSPKVLALIVIVVSVLAACPCRTSRATPSTTNSSPPVRFSCSTPGMSC
eukprot:scaffold46437_cov62-Phaeocystis_antarctica.AAC.3